MLYQLHEFQRAMSEPSDRLGSGCVELVRESRQSIGLRARRQRAVSRL